ncbi:hypothetical protein ACS0TY_020087 [Phlomoides rotata]
MVMDEMMMMMMEMKNSTVTDLENSQLLLDANPSNSLLRENIKALRAKTSFLCEVEISFLSQKAKCHFLANNDKNTKFFHCIVKRNHGRNHISSILGKDGVLTTSFEQVVTDFERFYYYLFGVETQRTPTGPCRLRMCSFILGMVRPQVLTDFLQVSMSLGCA